MRSLATILLLKSRCLKNFSFLILQIDFQLKQKNCKTLYEVQTPSRLRKLFSLPPTHPSPDKILLRLWNKNFLTEIYRNIYAFTFKVLQECGSWASRNDVKQMLFLTLNRNMSAGKFVKSERVWLCCGSKFLSMLSQLRFVKRVRFFERNCIV